jgi:photosystem II stability/assembly factor-like uncharacterized protein
VKGGGTFRRRPSALLLLTGVVLLSCQRDRARDHADPHRADGRVARDAADVTSPGGAASKDEADRWTILEFVKYEVPTSFASSGAALFASAGAGEGGGVYVSLDGGDSWGSFNIGLLGKTGVYALKVVGPYLFAGTDKGVYSSPLAMSLWMPHNKGIPRGTSADDFVEVDDTMLTTVPVEGVYRSSNGGKSWIRTRKGLKSTGVHPLLASGRHIFVGTEFEGAYRSSDTGSSWARLSGGLPTDIRRVEAFAVAGANLFLGSENGVFRSADGGDSWTKVRAGGDLLESRMAVLGSKLYLGTGKGVFRTSDGGNTWEDFSQGLKPESAWIRALTAQGDTVFASVRGGNTTPPYFARRRERRP